MKGSTDDLRNLEERVRLLRPRFSIAIAQPGLSKTRASEAQLHLLASTETYLRDTANADFSVHCSD